MASSNNRQMVIDVIYAFTGIDKELLKNATYIGGEEILKRNLEQKIQRTDVTIKINDNYQIIVEMNQVSSKNVFERIVLYGNSRIVENTKSNPDVYPMVTIINIDNFNKFKTDKPILEFMSRDETGTIIETEMNKSIHLILVNIQGTSYNIDKEIKKFTKF